MPANLAYRRLVEAVIARGGSQENADMLINIIAEAIGNPDQVGQTTDKEIAIVTVAPKKDDPETIKIRPLFKVK